jgi:DNA-binding response OmpR family regulator
MMAEKKRILIIEDDEEMGPLLKDFFRNEGFKVEHVEKGTYAFRKLMTESFALIISDIRLPGFNGLDILPGLRRFQPDTPIIVITAFGGEEVQRRAYEMGATVYLEKPIDFHELRKLIHKLIPLRKENERGVRNGRDSNCLPRKIGRGPDLLG